MRSQRLAALTYVVALWLALPASAASMAERSPFAQGQWWDPGRSGNGFEIVSIGDRVSLIWFTYDAAGRPVWYSAHGSLGSAAEWPLVRYRWSGAAAIAATVGSLRLDFRHAEGADVAWRIGEARGTWSIQPLVLSGVVNDVDHTGVWFAPANSGWGISLTDQGDALGGVVYTYDAAGEPTWVAGYARQAVRSIEFHAYDGPCPGCAYRAPVPRSVGTLAFDMHGEAAATVRGRLAVSMAAGVNVDGARIAQLGRPASTRPADRQLASFTEAGVLRAYLVEGMNNVPAISTGGQFSAPPPAVTFSPTNLQETGVDEAGLVKSDGVHVYTFVHEAGVRKPALRIARVAGDGAALDIRGSIPLASGPTSPVQSAGLFVHADKLVAVTGSQPIFFWGSPWLSSAAWSRGVTFVEVFDTAPATLPVSRWRVEIDGHVVASRRIGDRLYVVSRFVSYVPGFVYGATFEEARAANQALLANATLEDLLPKMRVDGGAAVPAVDVAAVHAPPQGSRQQRADMIVVTAIDVTNPGVLQTLAIVGTTDAVYASSGHLFVASARYDAFDGRGLLLPSPPTQYLTDIHQIRLGADAMTIVGSASVEGMLSSDPDKAPFRLSEHQGRLRVVTSSTSMWGGTKNRLTILEPSTVAPGLLRTAGYLPNERRPEPLGKPNEVLYGTRFLGERLYAVTFQRIDPLYVVDLSDASDPRIAGALEIPGFSDYLHPLHNGLLLGFGKEARPALVPGDGQFAWFQGLQLTLFDVSDASRPREIQRVVVGKRGSESALLRHHHAFSALQDADGTATIAIPARVHDGTTGPNDFDHAPWQYSGLLRFALRGTTPAEARLVPLPPLVTHHAAMDAFVNDDAATNGARSVLFPKGTVYVGNGRFWRMDASGATFGPY